MAYLTVSRDAIGDAAVEAGGIEGLDARLALGANGDETGFAQHFQVLGNGRGAHVEFVDEFAGGAVADGEEHVGAVPRVPQQDQRGGLPRLDAHGS